MQYILLSRDRKTLLRAANAVEAASKVLRRMAKTVPGEWYYKEDTEKSKRHTDSLTKLQNENSKLQKQEKRKKSNKKDSKRTRARLLKKELEANKKSDFISARIRIISDQKRDRETYKEVYNNLFVPILSKFSLPAFLRQH